MRELLGTGAIARLLGTTSPAVSNWIARYTDYPEPFGVSHGRRDRFFWTPDQAGEWRAWYKKMGERMKDDVVG